MGNQVGNPGKLTKVRRVRCASKAGSGLSKVARARGKVMAPVDVVSFLRDVLETVRVAQREATRRAEIEANLILALEQIRAQERAVLEYLDRHFEERRRILDMCEVMVQKSEGSVLNMVTDILLVIAQTPPLPGR